VEAGGSNTSSMNGNGKILSADSRCSSACDNALPTSSDRRQARIAQDSGAKITVVCIVSD